MEKLGGVFHIKICIFSYSFKFWLEVLSWFLICFIDTWEIDEKFSFPFCALNVRLTQQGLFQSEKQPRIKYNLSAWIVEAETKFLILLRCGTPASWQSFIPLLVITRKGTQLCESPPQVVIYKFIIKFCHQHGRHWNVNYINFLKFRHRFFFVYIFFWPLPVF